LYATPRAATKRSCISIRQLAHNLQLSVVAEGFENADIMCVRAHLNCDYMQGFHLGQAVPGADLANRLRDQSESK
jgi:EAL domain-containing protein (putative c-di-GMP-specific phosphodiesterase class I)